MFLNKKYCFTNESEARSHFSDLLSQRSEEDQHFFDKVLSTIFPVRRELLERAHSSSREKRPAALGLPDVCITANEDYVIPAFSAQGIGGCMEIRQYPFAEIPEGQPRIHAYVVITASGTEWIIDVDADPFYGENIGVIISPEKTDLIRVYEKGRVLRYDAAEGWYDPYEQLAQNPKVLLAPRTINEEDLWLSDPTGGWFCSDQHSMRRYGHHDTFAPFFEMLEHHTQL